MGVVNVSRPLAAFAIIGCEVRPWHYGIYEYRWLIVFQLGATRSFTNSVLNFGFSLN